MRSKHLLYLGVAALAGVLAAAPAGLKAQTVAIDNDDIGGVVTGPSGPEAGVWVIAETTDLGTKMAKMVVTDDQGRYVIPDLPKAKYKVWVRGYGLVDSQKVDAEPGKNLNLTAVKAPDEAAASQYYPAIYWYSMIHVPGADQFPGTGPSGNGINPAIKTQGQYLDQVKTNGCVTCHQLGNKATRTIPEEFSKDFKTGYEAWTRRIQSGQAGLQMVNAMERLGTQAGLKMFGDWSDRVARGELPSAKPQRPQGVERNAVITVWDWSRPTERQSRNTPRPRAWACRLRTASWDREPGASPRRRCSSRDRTPALCRSCSRSRRTPDRWRSRSGCACRSPSHRAGKLWRATNPIP